MTVTIISRDQLEELRPPPTPEISYSGSLSLRRKNHQRPKPKSRTKPLASGSTTETSSREGSNGKSTPLTDQTSPEMRPQADLPIRPVRDGKGSAPLIDIGANLTKPYFRDEDMVNVLRRASKAGLTHIVIIGANLTRSKQALEVCQKFDGKQGITLRCTIGIHPNDAHSTLFRKAKEPGVFVERALAKTYASELERLITSEAGQKYCVAVGECGLDYCRAKEHALYQKQVFRKQLALAEKTGLPLFLHSRDSHADFFSILKPYLGRVKAVVHCHTDPSIKNLKELLDAGCYIGLTGIICDERKGRFNKEIVKHIPLDRLMVETDAPFLLPRNALGGHQDRRRNNEPCLLPFVVREIAKLQDCGPKKIAHKTTEAAKQFFGLGDR